MRYRVFEKSITRYRVSEKSITRYRVVDIQIAKLQFIHVTTFSVYPQGIPCRSQLLPLSIKNLPELQSRNNEIMIGLCKVC